MKRIIFTSSFVLLTLFGTAQTLMPLPNHNRVYTGNVRGYWFTSPTDFVITGLRVPIQAGSGAQYIQVVKFLATPPAYPGSTTNYTTLAFINGTTNGIINSVNIPVATGDVIGVLGQDGNRGNSYGTPVGPFTTNIAGNTFSITRLLWQGTLTTSMAGALSEESAYEISRVELWWELPVYGPNDAGVRTIAEPSDTCTGQYMAKAEIKNYGTNQINGVDINWRYNGLLQTPVTYSQLLDTVNGIGNNTAIVNLGMVTLNNNVFNDIEAWTSMPNSVVDTTIRNDSASASLFGFPFPTLNLGPDITECSGVPVVLQGGSTRDSLRWSNNTTLDSLVIVNGTGQFHVAVYENGCASRDTINITRYPAPPTVDLGPDTTLCIGETLLLDATNTGVTYTWQDNSTNPTFTVSTAGTYKATITDGNGCESTDAINVSYYLEPTVQIFVSPGSDICNGVPVTFTAFPVTQGSIAYQWVVNGEPVGSSTTDPQFKGPVDYGDTVWVQLLTDVCSTSAYPVPSNKIEMKLNPSPKNITGKALVVENTKETYVVPLNSTSSYVWRIKGGTIDGDSTKNIVRVDWAGPNQNANLQLVETDEKNCVRENELPVNVVSIVGVDDPNFNIGKVYPNPTNQILNIPMNSLNNEKVNVKLFDITGRYIKSIYNGELKGSQVITIDVDEFNSGVYYIEMTANDGSRSIKKFTVN